MTFAANQFGTPAFLSNHQQATLYSRHRWRGVAPQRRSRQDGGNTRDGGRPNRPVARLPLETFFRVEDTIAQLKVPRLATRIAIAAAGSAVVFAGILMLVLPGPGVVAILVGLGILGKEFAWARSLSNRATGHIDNLRMHSWRFAAGAKTVLKKVRGQPKDSKAGMKVALALLCATVVLSMIAPMLTP